MVTSLLLPPTLVTGIFGMDTKGLPLTDCRPGLSLGGGLDGLLCRPRLSVHAALGHPQEIAHASRPRS
jgi:hypothetical protein